VMMEAPFAAPFSCITTVPSRATTGPAQPARNTGSHLSNATFQPDISGRIAARDLRRLHFASV